MQDCQWRGSSGNVALAQSGSLALALGCPKLSLLSFCCRPLPVLLARRCGPGGRLRQAHAEDVCAHYRRRLHPAPRGTFRCSMLTISHE